MSLRRINAMFTKELRHIVRDSRSLIMALGLPVLLLVLFGFALSLDVDRIPTLIYDADRTAASRDLVQRFLGSRFFEVRAMVQDYRTVEREIDRGAILAAIVIPERYALKLRAGQIAEVQILLDGSDSNTASIAKGYAETLIRTVDANIRSAAQQRRAGQTPQAAVDIRTRVWYNSSLESKNYVVPGLIAVILMIISALLTSLTIAREWESGTMEQLMSTPLRPAEMVIGKMLAFFVVGVTDSLIAVLTGVFLFQVPLRGNLVLLTLMTCLFLTGALFWGILISAIAKSQLLAYQMGILSSFLPAFLLSGFIYSIENMPPVIQAVTYVFPAKYFVTILKGIFLKGVGLEILWPPVLFLIAYSLIVFTLATKKLTAKLV
ncbi:MAG: ABC transporter permease [Bryobacteraceae bacterium]|nr:ABC transporter permease [Bryobacteraceae bacterium]